MLLPRVLKVAVSALSVGVVTMAQLNLPNSGFWAELRLVQYLAVAGLVVVAGVEVVSSVVEQLKLPQVRQFEQELRAVLSAGVSGLARSSAADWRDIGVSVYHLRGWPWLRKLVLVDNLRLGTGPKLGTRWRPGHGVVGAAYEQENLVAVDWESYFKSAEDAGPAAWRARSDLERFGLSWGELMRTQSLVNIAAAPVFGEGGKLTGVVCAQAPADLSAQVVGATMRDLANAVGDLGAPPASWWSYVGRQGR